MIAKDSVLKSLIALLGVFILGYSAIISVHILFKSIISDLDFAVKNESARYQIGEYILKEINSVERQYYQMALSFNTKSLSPLEKDIKTNIANVSKAIHILENGGRLQKHIDLNMVGINQTIEIITFQPNQKSNYTFEAIDLMPKLEIIETNIVDMRRIVQLKNDLTKSNSNDPFAQNKLFEIQMFFKSIPPLFTRMKENASRLLYESKNNLIKLEENIIKEKKYYENLEIVVTLIVMGFVFILGYVVIQQILQKSKELEFLTLQAKKSAQEASNANEIKSKFLANMSHEIRTPLNAIIGFSELLEKSSLPNEEKEKASIIVKSAKALLNIINDILDLSKVESGKLEISQENIDLKKAMSQIVELYSLSAQQKNIRFVYNIESQIPTMVVCDDTRLKQVISNLLSNAIKFTPNGGKVQFDLKLLDVKEKIAKIRFSIQDNGVGIPMESQENIFEPFSQADGSVSRKFGGTGLGLSISDKIIQLMGGKIVVVSRPNHGSRFYFDLELHSDEHISKESLNYSTKGYNFALCSLSEDEDFIHENLKNILLEYGSILEDYPSIQKASNIELVFCFMNMENFINDIEEIKKKFHSSIVYVGDKEKIENNPTLTSLVDFYLDIPLYGSKVFNIISKACNIEKQSLPLEEYSNISFQGDILVAEDNPNNQMLIKILLENAGVNPTIVENGKEAYETYKKQNFDLILMDINMPIMDGISALKLIRDFEKQKETRTPIIALTANAIKGDKEKYLQSGMDNYLAKPIDSTKLMELLRQYLPSKMQLSKNEEENFATLKIDAKEVSQKLGVSEKIGEILINKFKADINNDLAELAEFIKENNKEQISKKAHYIKNSCLNLGLKELCEILQRIETDSLEKENLKNEFQSLEKIIQKIV